MKITLIEDLSRPDKNQINRVTREQIKERLPALFAQALREDPKLQKQLNNHLKKYGKKREEELKKMMKEVAQEVLQNFHRLLWFKRNFWKRGL